jgi:transposase
MSWAGVRIGVGARVEFDGEIHEVTEWIPSAAGTEIVLKGAVSLRRMSVVALLSDMRARLIPDTKGPEPDDSEVPAAVVLIGLSGSELQEVRERAEHIREVLTGFRSGSEEAKLAGEPRADFDPKLPLKSRYEAKARELGVDSRTMQRWVKAYREHGDASLADRRRGATSRVDERWGETALAIMRDHTNESKPSGASVILQTAARLESCLGEGSVKEPSRATAYRRLKKLDKKHRTFSGTTKRNRDIASRPNRPYGKLRPARPGEYLILDTTRLDVFALDPLTLRWVQVELTAAMDWYTRCIVAIRLTPVSTKAVDAAAVMYQVFRPPLAGANWPAHAVWPEHGVPREVLIDPDKIDRTGKAAAGPAITPETIVVDHGKIYVSEHLNSVCQRMGISIQPARLKEGRDKGPLERFFRTVRDGLLQYLPGYKGPDINARGLDVEGHAFFYIDQLESIVREWVAAVYHHRMHDSLLDPGLPSARMTPAQMFSHGIARAGYIEAPRHPHLAYEFLRAEPRTIQHYGVQRGKLVYKGDVLAELSQMTSPYSGKFKNRWPVHVDPDNIARVYIKHPTTRLWHELIWEHAKDVPMPFSDDALRHARKAVLDKHGFIDDRLALTELLNRWQLGMETSPAERRMALRLARQNAVLSNQVDCDDCETVLALPAIQALGSGDQSKPRKFEDPVEPRCGDDDDAAELQDDYDEDDALDWS